MKVMIIQPDPWLNEMYARQFEAEDHEVRTALDAQSGVETLDNWAADAILLDLGLPGNSGIEVLHELQSYDDFAETPVVVVSNRAPESFKLSESEWEGYGVKKVFYKPQVRLEDLVKEVEVLGE